MQRKIASLLIVAALMLTAYALAGETQPAVNGKWFITAIDGTDHSVTGQTGSIYLAPNGSMTMEYTILDTGSAGSVTGGTWRWEGETLVVADQAGEIRFTLRYQPDEGSGDLLTGESAGRTVTLSRITPSADQHKPDASVTDQASFYGRWTLIPSGQTDPGVTVTLTFEAGDGGAAKLTLESISGANNDTTNTPMTLIMAGDDLVCDLGGGRSDRYTLCDGGTVIQLSRWEGDSAQELQPRLYFAKASE